jgi:UDP-galactopyranose mutase
MNKGEAMIKSNTMPTQSSELISQRAVESPANVKIKPSIKSRPAATSVDAIQKNPDLVCFSHLRWDFVYQRPQHLLSRAARDRRVFFVEEPIFDEGSMRLDISERVDGLHVVVPYLPKGLSSDIATHAVLSGMIGQLLKQHRVTDFVAWYYTPAAIGFTDHLKPLATIYDCMDELSAFKGAPISLCEQEKRLFQIADLVFTGGQSLYEAKKDKHKSVHAHPSSIDRNHFGRARERSEDPLDQETISHPRLGFFGVIDERFDTQLLDGLATARPDWHFVMIGPVVKIDPADLPKQPNIHYLGAKTYDELPSYLAGWDVALLLFARNEATRFISPTKTPEYLAAGKPVVSTSIHDVVRPYGDEGLVEIADTTEDFVDAVERIFSRTDKERRAWLQRVDEFLSVMSWDETWQRMSDSIDEVVATRLKLRRTRSESGRAKTYAAGAVSAA